MVISETSGFQGSGKPFALDFSNGRFERIRASQLIEEENLPDYLATRYYPVRIGNVLASRYQVVGKLGYGATSTVWMARDLLGHRHVALKIFIHSGSLGCDPSHELSAYQRLDQGPASHPGRQAVRALFNSFTISGPDGAHQCLVHPPLWDSMQTFLARNPIGRLPTPVLAITLKQVLLALDYARQCGVIHTARVTSCFGIEDTAILEKFEQAELENPTPRKEINGRIIYLSHTLENPTALRYGLPVLCDFGSAAWGEEEHKEDVQSDVYRSPEVILKVPWSYEIDIWNVGCMIWDLFEGRHLFYGTDPERGTYRSRAHLAEIISLLGPPPPGFVAQGALRSRFFSEQGEFQAGIEVPPRVSLEQLETNLRGSDKTLFLQFVSKMLQWDPKNRQTAKQLLEDEWLKNHT
ncbi:hypothetical protein AGABI1DRAFT_123298 [Agaricus bisporus var. burnettii JB137-S8]|uniref:non-specific serine/threonine protein kinase n=1 Tax=Agaricus bisporus var. burnettii (strain JB137-S8 / ATCC MYA-4627 / FGSC 10392) TaxID=597362 RepID=K5WWU7_AGABU|nr:uncharacterized protein AGABI1DRAFT_123298 [Agaricus bisporus var. burnettii JB137-S8]EKM75278.1 hypothetical protein AGABI1DRAFT_123298 [Agaricus bisporus var. burnettii JB137-S8]